jgi:PPOX class probable FMN-dependent enzyme
MDCDNPGHRVTDLAALERIYGAPNPNSLRKEIPYLHPLYRAFIAASPFAILATSGPGGLDASPKGDAPGFVTVEDEKTLLIPDRKGNNRIDGLRNLVTDPRVSLIFLVPGVGETLRVIGRADITVAPALLKRFAVEGKEPRCVLVVHIESVYFHCSKAILRSKLWDAALHVDRKSLPSAGDILSALTDAEVDGARYDRELTERLKTGLY